MLTPGEVPSDIDLTKENADQLAGRWAILVDLTGHFQGSYLVYLTLAIVIPTVAVIGLAWGWFEDQVFTLVITITAFVALIALSIQSFALYRWTKKRSDLAFKLMIKKQDEEENRDLSLDGSV